MRVGGLEPRMIVATNGEESAPVQLVHWWPTRWPWDGFYGANQYPMTLVWRARRDGTRYMTMARVDLGGCTVSTVARCCPRDQPSRAIGRFLALLRLGRALRKLGWELEAV